MGPDYSIWQPPAVHAKSALRTSLSPLQFFSHFRDTVFPHFIFGVLEPPKTFFSFLLFPPLRGQPGRQVPKGSTPPCVKTGGLPRVCRAYKGLKHATLARGFRVPPSWSMRVLAIWTGIVVNNKLEFPPSLTLDPSSQPLPRPKINWVAFESFHLPSPSPADSAHQ